MAKLHFSSDGDGVLWRAGEQVGGAAEFLTFLRQCGIGYSLLSNNSSRTRAAAAEAAQRFGLELGAADVFNTNYLAGRYLGEHYAGSEIMVIGSSQLRGELKSCGLRVYAPEEVLGPEAQADPGLTAAPFLASSLAHEPAVVVVGIDTGLTWAKLALACRLIEDGAAFIATNRDFSFPVERGYMLPGNGAAVALIEGVTGVAPVNLGKPETLLVELALAEKGLRREEAVMVGDRLETDMEMALRAGIRSVLVLTGTTQEAPERWPENRRPTFVVRDLNELRKDFPTLFPEAKE